MCIREYERRPPLVAHVCRPVSILHVGDHPDDGDTSIARMRCFCSNLRPLGKTTASLKYVHGTYTSHMFTIYAQSACDRCCDSRSRCIQKKDGTFDLRECRRRQAAALPSSVIYIMILVFIQNAFPRARRLFDAPDRIYGNHQVYTTAATA